MKRLILLLISFCSLFMISCLKDDRLLLDPDKTYNLIEFANISNIVKANTTTPVYTAALNLLPTGEVTLEVSYSGADEGAPKDITVQIGVGSTDIISQYNSENNTRYEMIPAELFNLQTTSVTIKKGKRRAPFVLDFKPILFDLSKLYVVPLEIKSASSGVISTNFSKMLLNISAKNKYDGIYHVEAIEPMVDVTSRNLTGYYPMGQELRTIGEFSVGEFDNFAWPPYNFYHPIRSSGNPSVYGNFSPVFEMDEQGNVVSVVNYYGQGNNANGRAARLDPKGENKWTVSGDSRVMKVAYVMVERGDDRTFFHEEWTFKSLRD